MIFETDHRLTTPAAVASSYFFASPARLFNILSDPASWGQTLIPRVASATPHGKVVLTFDGSQRATVGISSWNSEYSELEVVVDGFSDQSTRQWLENYWVEVASMLRRRLGAESFVVGSSPGKLNVFFAVGAFQKDGFHEVASCYQGLSLREKVLVEISGKFSIAFAGPMAEQCKISVPTDSKNLIFQAGVVLQELDPSVRPELVSFVIHKSVPIAGGMAGGSADAAAALVALNQLFGVGLDDRLAELAKKLGSDVPFSIQGGTAIGLGRGEKLSSVATEGVLHWVITPSNFGLSTPEVYRRLDVLRTEAGVDVSKIETPEVPEELISALKDGDAIGVSEYMHNDLEIAALSLRPELTKLLDAGRKAGALKSMVSGSGPTVAHLAKNRIHAEQIAGRLTIAGYPSLATYSSAVGTRVEA